MHCRWLFHRLSTRWSGRLCCCWTFCNHLSPCRLTWMYAQDRMRCRRSPNRSLTCCSSRLCCCWTFCSHLSPCRPGPSGRGTQRTRGRCHSGSELGPRRSEGVRVEEIDVRTRFERATLNVLHRNGCRLMRVDKSLNGRKTWRKATQPNQRRQGPGQRQQRRRPKPTIRRRHTWIYLATEEFRKNTNS